MRSFAMVMIRPYAADDAEALWGILQPVLRAAETYALPPHWDRAEALAYWCAAAREVFLAEEDGAIVGTYFLQANQQGGGDHVANCGYMTSGHATGRGIAAALCAHSLERAAVRGFRAMQFNFVVGTNTRAVALWRRFGFDVVGRLPRAFRHPTLGLVDALVMFRDLAPPRRETRRSLRGQSGVRFGAIRCALRRRRRRADPAAGRTVRPQAQPSAKGPRCG